MFELPKPEKKLPKDANLKNKASKRKESLGAFVLR
jgi:hypothetical protein